MRIGGQIERVSINCRRSFRWCPLRRQRRAAISSDCERTVSDWWCLHHKLRVPERRHHGEKSPDDQCGRAVRSQSRHQSGPARGRYAGRPVDDTVEGLGTLYRWNVWSPRLGVTAKLTSDGRTMLRTSYRRFTQGVLTGELSPFHPGATPTTTAGVRFGNRRRTLQSYFGRRPQEEPATRCQHASTAHRWHLSASIGSLRGNSQSLSPTFTRLALTSSAWTDTGGQYREETRVLPDGQTCRCTSSRTPPPTGGFC